MTPNETFLARGLNHFAEPPTQKITMSSTLSRLLVDLCDSGEYLNSPYKYRDNDRMEMAGKGIRQEREKRHRRRRRRRLKAGYTYDKTRELVPR